MDSARNCWKQAFRCSVIWEVPCRLPGLKQSCGIYTIPEMHLRFSTDFLFYRLWINWPAFWLYDVFRKETYSHEYKQNFNEKAEQRWKALQSVSVNHTGWCWYREISSMVRNFPSEKTGPWCRHIFHLPLTTTRDLYLLLSFMIIRKNA